MKSNISLEIEQGSIKIKFVKIKVGHVHVSSRLNYNLQFLKFDDEHI